MRVIGLTGLAASGKSTVGKYLAEKQGVKVIDADVLIRKIRETPEIQEQLKEKLGTTKPSEIRQIIFNNQQKQAWLEKLLWGRLEIKIEQLLKKAALDKVNLVVIEAIKLEEAGLNQLCDEVWLMTAEIAKRQKRLAKRYGTLSEIKEIEAAQQGIRAAENGKNQLTAARKIENNGDFRELWSKIDLIWQKMS